MINSLECTIWGREFFLPIDFDCFDDEEPYNAQKNSLEKFLANIQWISESKQLLENFCRDKVLEDDTNEKKDDIFSYIKPDYVFVKREKKNARVALMCKYRYDQEHGLALIFTYKGEVSVARQDDVL